MLLFNLKFRIYKFIFFTFIFFYSIILYSQQLISSSLPVNPFGVGVPYTFFKVNTLSERASFRKSQLENAKILTGKGGYVRIWCFLDYNFEGLAKSGEMLRDGPSECVEAVKQAHMLDLVPVVLFQDGVWKDSNSPINGNGAYTKFNEYSNKVAEVVLKLNSVTPENRVVWVEMANEPNWTESWFSRSGSEVIQAAELAYQISQTIDAIRFKTTNSVKVKILGPALSPFGSVSQQNSNGNKPFTERSDGFVKKMGIAVPGLFRRYDAWNSHAYPDSVFTGSDCKCGLETQYGMTAYRYELKAAGLNPNTPVILTEAGIWNNQNDGADFIAKVDQNGRGSGAFPRVWFGPEIQYNNIQAVIGFLLGIPSPEYAPYNWLDPWRSIGYGGPVTVNDWTPIFKRVVQYRQQVLPTSQLPEGRYRIPNGSIYYSNGMGALCGYENMSEFIWGGGKADLSNVKSVLAIPFSFNKLNGKCIAILPSGRYRIPDGTILFSNGKGAYCSYSNMKQFLKAGGNADLSNVTSISSVPLGNKSEGICP